MERMHNSEPVSDESLKKDYLQNDSTKETETIDVILKRYHAQMKRYEKRSNATKRLSIFGGMIITIINAILIMTVASKGLSPPLPYIYAVLSIYVGIFFTMSLSLLHTDHQRRLLQTGLSKRDDVRVIGPLIDLFDSADTRTRQAVQNSLIRLLPQLDAVSAQELSKSQKEQLYSLLQVGGNERIELQLAVLKAIRYIGDRDALHAVTWLAESAPEEGRWGRLRLAAKETLPYLKQRVAQEPNRQSLLRPAKSVLSQTGAELLHPISSSKSHTPEMLLHSVGSDTPDK